MKRALLVGMDSYHNFRPLAGCCNDVKAIAPLLRRNEDENRNFYCETRTSDLSFITRDALLRDLERLFAPATDMALLYFAGHGQPVPNDVVLCTADGTTTSPGVSLSMVLSMVEQSPVPEVIVLLDCCFSGAAGGVPQLGSSAATIRSGLSIITAARADQMAVEAAGRGLFATYLEDALRGGAADLLGKVTVAGVYAYLSDMFGPWDQRPTFKANIDRPHELRQTSPDFTPKQLRALVTLFPTPTYELPLGPSYEPDVEPHNQRHEEDFGILQAARAVKLVEPVGELHMYYAAINSKACRLTKIGQHYWQLVENDRL
ncbi:MULTISPECIES: caspase family protein [unclassified Pseudofrankia]|uniref:caspase family protein n=1 Tax=unclassified Pseudofrankia TaxID=2994372 RepID=UPI0008DA7AE0|nr:MULTISPECIES: caspase family protein [unclassified Pseudofrankia]MDT3443938.1 caspase family protein [Pseudofrankia sp. BMG5.37]OHV68207.1 peptidase C14 [Pseudofrankia sp. BMG5.36]